MKPFLIILIACFTLSACHFKLRNQNTLPEKLHGLYVQSEKPYSRFTLDLKNTLNLLGLQPASSQKAGTVTLRLFDTGFTYTAPDINASNQTRTYTLHYKACFELIKKGKVIVPPQTIQLSRFLITNANQTLYSNNDANTLKREMQQEAISLLLYRLSSNRVRQAL